jgi:hypothetical protein
MDRHVTPYASINHPSVVREAHQLDITAFKVPSILPMSINTNDGMETRYSPGEQAVLHGPRRALVKEKLCLQQYLPKLARSKPSKDCTGFKRPDHT